MCVEPVFLFATSICTWNYLRERKKHRFKCILIKLLNIIIKVTFFNCPNVYVSISQIRTNKQTC